MSASLKVVVALVAALTAGAGGGAVFAGPAFGGTSAAPARSTVHAQQVTATSPGRVNTEFAALAGSLPVCGKDPVTNCRYGTPATHVLASVQSTTATIYFEMRHGVVTVLEVYPFAR